MPTFEFVLPELGEGIESGDVVQVLVTVGDTIAKEQAVLELETDKAVVEVPAPVSAPCRPSMCGPVIKPRWDNCS